MAGRKDSTGRGIDAIMSLIAIQPSSGQELLIVEKGALYKLLGRIPTDIVNEFVTDILVVPNAQTEKPLIDLFRIARAKLNVSQEKFAAILRENAGIKIHASDVGNIEKGLRVEDYASERLQKFKEAVLKIIG